MKFVLSCLLLFAMVSSSPTRHHWPGTRVEVVCNEEAVSTTGIQELPKFAPDHVYSLLLCVEISGAHEITACEKPDKKTGQIEFTLNVYSDKENLLYSTPYSFDVTTVKDQQLCHLETPAFFTVMFPEGEKMPATTRVELKVGMGAAAGETGQYFSASIRATVYSVDKVEKDVVLDRTALHTVHSVVCKAPHCYVTAGLSRAATIERYSTKEASWPVFRWNHENWNENFFSVFSIVCQQPDCPKTLTIASLPIGELGCKLGCVTLPWNIPQLVACVMAAKLEGNAITSLVNCGRHATKGNCEATANAPRCTWVEAPDDFVSNLGKSACIPAKLLPDIDVLVAALARYKSILQAATVASSSDIVACFKEKSGFLDKSACLPPDILPDLDALLEVLQQSKSLLQAADVPNYADMIACLGQSGIDCAEGEKRADGTRIECELLTGIPVQATNSVKPKITQLCLLRSVKDLGFRSLVLQSYGAKCPERPAGKYSSAQSTSVLLVSCMVSLCILLMSFV